MKRLLVLLAAALALPAAASASPTAEVGMEDERILLGGGPAAEQAVADWAALGVDVVRIHARWNVLAPDATSRRPPAGFNAADHKDPEYDWSELDAAVETTRAAGLKVMLTVTGPGPIWTSRFPGKGNPRLEPDPRHYAAFAKAVATRFGDRVDRYLLWNEPNLASWLEPQWRCRSLGRRAPMPRGFVRAGGRQACEVYGATVYRRLVRAAGPAIEAADRGAEIVIGELAPIGRGRAGVSGQVSPLLWLRGMACVDGDYRPIRTGMCAGFQPAAADSFGHHPHPILRAPDEANPNADDAQFAELSRLASALDRFTKAGRVRTPGRRPLGLHLTEFGYQTSPPDHGIGIPLGTQARWLQHAAFEAWRQPRILGLTHYQWEDEPVTWRSPTNAYHGWQSGLKLIGGEPKPALAAFPNPFAVELRRRGPARAWGQVRPGGAHFVTLVRRRGGGAFAEVGRYVTTPAGYWSGDVSVKAGDELRFTWQDQLAAERVSGVARIPAGGKPRVIAAAAP